MRTLKEDPWTLYISDVGGQLEFQELIPALTNGPSLHFLVVAANIGLNNRCPVVYHCKSGSTKPYDSNHTLKENVLQQLATIMSTGKKGLEPKIVFFLTFTDKVTPQKLSQIDQELMQAVKCTDAFTSGAIELADVGLLCHAIDNTNPSAEDLLRIRRSVERIGKREGVGSTYKVLTPCSWLQFGIALRLTNSPVLKYDDCVKIGHQCNIFSTEELNDALRFLHYKVGLIRYFGTVEQLKDIVIVQPKILFGNVTRLVKDTFTFKNLPPFKFEMFCYKGIFSKDMVRKINTGSKLLTRDKLLVFLKHHHILAPVSEERYFLPCSLVHAKQPEESQRESEIPPLLIAYERGYVPRGVFGFAIADLITNQLNQMSLEEDKIYRDQVTFQYGPYLSEIRLSSFPAYIRIDVFPKYANEFSTAEMCCKIKRQMESSLSTVIKKLNYTENVNYYVGFMCTLCDVVHPAKLKQHKGKYLLTCKIKKKPIPPPEGYLLWFNEVLVLTVQSSFQPTVNQFDQTVGFMCNTKIMACHTIIPLFAAS